MDKGRGGPVPCGRSGHVDPEKENDEIGFVMCGGE